MKTGRLLKFRRQGVEIHAYFYGEGGAFRAAVYLRAPGTRGGEQPIAEVEAPSLEAAERKVRAWVDGRYPRVSLRT